MLYDYDLVVIGDSLAGRWAALSAARQHARIAWVQQSPNQHLGLTETYQHLCKLWSQHNWLSGQAPFPSLKVLREWMKETQQNLSQTYPIKYLAESGIDVIQDQGHFLPLQKKKRAVPVFEVKHRQLRSRRYLLALEGDRTGDRTTTDLVNGSYLEQQATTEPQKITIANQNPESIFTGQILKAFNFDVSISASGKLLPHEDQDLSFFLQNQLEAQGIKILSSSTTKPHSSPITSDINGLKLNELGKPTPTSRSTKRLEYLAPFIYACGEVWGGYPSPDITMQEASIALENALFEKKAVIQYAQTPYSLPLLGGFHRIGLTENQAQRHYSQVQTLQAAGECLTTAGAQSLFGKLVVLPSGKILGLHILGLDHASLPILFQQILQDRLTVNDLPKLAIDSPILRRVFENLHRQWTQGEPLKSRDRQERYFRTKRKQFS